jgi:ribosome-associated heat shock protein Hsp15
MSPEDSTPDGAPASSRLDVWLDFACLFKTRSEALGAISAGKVEVNGQRVKPHRMLRKGDQISIERGNGRTQRVVALSFATHHLAKALARKLYEDKTPPPTPEEIETRRVERLLREAAGPVPDRAPDRRDRRALRRLKGLPS